MIEKVPSDICAQQRFRSDCAFLTGRILDSQTWSDCVDATQKCYNVQERFPLKRMLFWSIDFYPTIVPIMSLSLCPQFFLTVYIGVIVIVIQWNLVTTTQFVPKDVAIKMNLLLYRILNEQIDM